MKMRSMSGDIILVDMYTPWPNKVSLGCKVIKKQTPVDSEIEWVIVVQLRKISAISWREQVNFQWDDDEVRSVLDQNA
jgi:hypothetical protein